jgi:hypothetical protein
MDEDMKKVANETPEFKVHGSLDEITGGAGKSPGTADN